jgi:Na+/H+-dicarboxylate symporter
MAAQGRVFKPDRFALLLLLSLGVGCWAGLHLGARTAALKPFGDLFLNLLFTCAVPLVFFSISSTFAGMKDLKHLSSVLAWMVLIFVVTGLIAAALMIAVVTSLPFSGEGWPALTGAEVISDPPSLLDGLVGAISVSDFTDLFSRRHMLALIIFAAFLGLAVSRLDERGRSIASFLRAASEAMVKLVSFVMLYAPIGLGAYFAYVVGQLGADVLDSYVQALAIYYPVSLAYFVIALSVYAYWGGGVRGLKRFWPAILTPAFTAFGTGSSVAAIPANLKAADQIGTPRDVSEIVIPVGATVHMDGTCLSAILKIAFAFAVTGQTFSGAETLLMAAGVALLSGVVMSGIPGGGFLGEVLIVGVYGFPPEILPMLAMIGVLVDPPATMVNAAGDNAAAMMLARLTDRKIASVHSRG